MLISFLVTALLASLLIVSGLTSNSFAEEMPDATDVDR